MQRFSKVKVVSVVMCDSCLCLKLFSSSVNNDLNINQQNYLESESKLMQIGCALKSHL